MSQPSTSKTMTIGESEYEDLDGGAWRAIADDDPLLEVPSGEVPRST
jgi:hypothetical protein